MTVHVEAGCKCGERLTTNELRLSGALAVERAWRAEHTGPTHRPCGAEEARRIARRERVGA